MLFVAGNVGQRLCAYLYVYLGSKDIMDYNT